MRFSRLFGKLNLSRLAYFALLAFVLAIVIPNASAQYFGRNKVQYKHFNFKIVKTQHFDIYFYPEEETEAQRAGRIAERWYNRFSRFLNHNLRGRQALIIYSSQPDFQQTTVLPGVIGEGTGGVTESIRRRIILPFGYSLAQSDHVIGHELVHAFQYDMAGLGSTQTAGQTGDIRLPLWWIEGQAEYLSIGPIDPNTAMWMRDAIRKKEFPTLKKLDDPRYFPYRWGQAFWSYVGGRWGDETVSRLMNSVGRVGDYQTLLEKTLKISIKQLGSDWQAAIKAAYDPLLSTEEQKVVLTRTATPPPPEGAPGLTQLQDRSSRVLIKGKEEGSYNISPSLSPDGKSLIFFSTRDLFSIEMYEADAQTGKVFGKLTETAVSPHFESLQFISSVGSWDHQGKRFVIGSISEGHPELTIFNMSNKKIEKEIPFRQVDEVLNPTWSPDGKRIVFSAMSGGVTDIFIYDFDSGNLKQMTNDPYADHNPVWSPDGRSIAFATERFSTDLSMLSIGRYQLALMDPESGEVRKLAGFDNAKNINPQWSGDSKSLYFISDQNGISDIYRMELASGNIFQVTDLYTGVAGITVESPAFSVARDTNRLVYSAYLAGQYEIYSIDTPEALAGKPSLTQFGALKPSILPPTERVASSLLGLLRNPLFGLPEQTTFAVASYKPKLTLDYVAQPSVGFGVDRYGTYAGGGIALFWNDMLGEHTLETIAQVNGRIKYSGGLVGYINSARRMNWGVVAQRIPYLYGGFSVTEEVINGEPAIVQREYTFAQIDNQVSGFVTYPFNQIQRVELSGGYEYIGFSNEVFTQAVGLQSGNLLIDQIDSLPSPPGFHFWNASLALIYDSSLFGATGPIIGQSYIVEAMPQIGTISVSSVLLDYRRYLMPVRPFTLAFRALHYGRYGHGADDPRLYPLYIGLDGLVRGYDFGSFSAAEYDPSGKNFFDFNRLLGSKIAIANAELRFPLFGVLHLGRGYYGFFPVDFVSFFDAGMAWMNGDTIWPSKSYSRTPVLRKPITSAGVGLRINVLGYLVIGFNYVKPFARPGKGWYFQFSFYPGF